MSDSDVSAPVSPLSQHKFSRFRVGITFKGFKDGVAPIGIVFMPDFMNTSRLTQLIYMYFKICRVQITEYKL